MLQACAQAWSGEKAGLCEELNGGHAARVWEEREGEEGMQEGRQQELIMWGPASWVEYCFLSTLLLPGI